MSFVGRKRELDQLEKAWRTEQSAFIPIYGRRRVGKSELIVHFMKGKPGIYLTGKHAAPTDQISEFLGTAARELREPIIAEMTPRGWKTAFELAVKSHRGPGKLIIALDEFQWMVEVSPELPEVLQELWDRQWSNGNNVVLIVCGSFLGFMERKVLGSKSPLYGRRTGSIHLRPFNHIEARGFHPHLSIDDQARVYGICGGIPAYLKAFEDDLSVAQNIVAAILTPGGRLDGEPEYLLREELRELVPYHTVLTSLARGTARPVDLAKTTHIDVRALNYHLKTLIDLGYVKKHRPLTDPPSDERTVRYAVDDPILRFWFRFVFPNLSSLRSLGPSAAFADLIRPELDSYYGLCFDRLCREALPLIYANEGVRTSFEVGEFWRNTGKKVQIDVVGLRRDNRTDLGECKWGDDPGSLNSLAAQLELKVPLYPNDRGASIGRRLFVHQVRRRHDVPPGVRVHTLADLYALPAPP